MTAAVPAPGFGDPVHEAQRAFRAALEALSRPGRIQSLASAFEGLPLGAAMARLLLALTDDDTPVWWQRPRRELQDWLRFHTGARPAASPHDAAFAVITDPGALPPLAGFAQGTLASPELSTTLLVEVPSLHAGAELQAYGPGIAARQALRIDGLREGFWADWRANHAAFPQGVDLFFTCGDGLLGLPRTSRVARLEEV